MASKLCVLFGKDADKTIKEYGSGKFPLTRYGISYQLSK
jgi:hypothetical protein